MKYKNISSVIQKSCSSNILWSISQFYQCIEAFNQGSIQTSFWEEEENWATILSSGEVIGYLWKKYPLLIYVKGCEELIREGLVVPQLERIKVSNLASPELILNKKLSINAFGIDLSKEKFSAEELWFKTNT